MRDIHNSIPCALRYIYADTQYIYAERYTYTENSNALGIRRYAIHTYIKISLHRELIRARYT